MKTAYLKRIVVRQSNQNDVKLSNQHDFLVLNKEKVYLGRSTKDCDLVLKPKIISRKHVLFTYNSLDEGWNIECLNDKNGVFLNGKKLKKNQVKKLDDNCVISFGPTFLTNFVYEFTTKESSIAKKTDSITTVSIPSSNSSFDSSIISLPSTENIKRIKIEDSIANQDLSANLINLEARFNSITGKMNNANSDESKSNTKKIRLLKARIKHLENKVNVYRTQCKTSRLKFKRLSSKLKLYQSTTSRQKLLLRNTKNMLNKERNKKKELQKQLADQDKYNNELNNQIRLHKVQIKKENISPIEDNLNCSINENDQTNKIVQKYNELFSEDFTCGVCLELFLEPKILTCGHSFCKFCIVEWLKRNQNKRECPLCRSGFKGHFKNVVIENIIEKYLVTADKEVLETRERLKNEREKVIESRIREENDSNNEENRRNRLLDQFDFDIGRLHRTIHLNALGNARMINFDDVADYDFFGNDDSDDDEYENEFEVFNDDNLDEYQDDDENLDEENDSNNEDDDYESELEYDIVIE